MKALIKSPLAANVMAGIAMFLALSGVAAAVTLAPRNSVTSASIKDGEVKTADLQRRSAANSRALGGVPPKGYARASTVPVRLVGRGANPAFEGGWKNLSGDNAPVAFYKDEFGVVHLEGAAKPTGSVGTIFTLPKGYRPDVTGYRAFAVLTDFDKTAYLDVEADGKVQGPAAAAMVSLEGVSFRAAR